MNIVRGLNSGFSQPIVGLFPPIPSIFLIPYSYSNRIDSKRKLVFTFVKSYHIGRMTSNLATRSSHHPQPTDSGTPAATPVTCMQPSLSPSNSSPPSPSIIPRSTLSPIPISVRSPAPTPQRSPDPSPQHLASLLNFFSPSGTLPNAILSSLSAFLKRAALGSVGSKYVGRGMGPALWDLMPATRVWDLLSATLPGYDSNTEARPSSSAHPATQGGRATGSGLPQLA